MPTNVVLWVIYKWASDVGSYFVLIFTHMIVVFQNLCINEDVKKLKHLTLINDRCLEMQRNKKKSTWPYTLHDRRIELMLYAYR